MEDGRLTAAAQQLKDRSARGSRWRRCVTALWLLDRKETITTMATTKVLPRTAPRSDKKMVSGHFTKLLPRCAWLGVVSPKRAMINNCTFGKSPVTATLQRLYTDFTRSCRRLLCGKSLV